MVARNETSYVAMHDVDMLPVTASYSHPAGPMGVAHLASEASQFSHQIPYPRYCGGVLLIDNKLMEQVNGYSNHYWGWGAEDDDFALRLVNHLHGGGWSEALRSILKSSARPDIPLQAGVGVHPLSDVCNTNRTLEDVFLNRPQKGQGRYLSFGHVAHRTAASQLHTQENWKHLALVKRLLRNNINVGQSDGLSSAKEMTSRFERHHFDSHTLIRVYPEHDQATKAAPT
mmetsp:Transcript_1596/g.2963  ORF Transcript_1596/g.2963 Transcript_1596/m.2963 type:complete len:229 (+) Transcript_1596:121-807(+)